MKRKLVVCLAAALLCIAPAAGFLGITVFDPTNWAEAINQLREMERQYRQMVETYNKIRQQYDHMVYMAKRVPVNMATRYRAAPTPWRTSSATNTYGTTGPWMTAANTGSGVMAGYQRAIQAINAYGAALANVPADQLERLKKTYGTVELADGVNIHSIETVGVLRSNAPAVERAIQGLEDDSLSSDPDMNTEIAVLNKINAAGLIAIRTAQDANKLLVVLNEQQIVEAKRKRDAEAHAINNHIRLMRDGRAVLTSQAAGASEAMMSWRMP